MEIKLPKKQSLENIRDFFYKRKLFNLLKASHKDHETLGVDDVFKPKYYPADLKLLYRLYQLVQLNKRTTIVEFGSGWSTMVFASALNENKKKYFEKIKKLRRNNPFELFVLENVGKYKKITKNKISNFVKKYNIEVKPNWIKTEARMTTFNGRFVTEYEKLPLCCPDFIYLDGPSQFSIKNKINNFSTAHKDIVPIGCDILKIEYFLTPGTIVIVDGRAANAKFLKDHFKRKWKYFKDPDYDQHIFYLADPVLGRWNKLQLDFYKSK